VCSTTTQGDRERKEKNTIHCVARKSYLSRGEGDYFYNLQEKRRDDPDPSLRIEDVFFDHAGALQKAISSK